MEYKKIEGSVKLRAYDLNVVNPKGLMIANSYHTRLKKIQGVPFLVRQQIKETKCSTRQRFCDASIPSNKIINHDMRDTPMTPYEYITIRPYEMRIGRHLQIRHIQT